MEITVQMVRALSIMMEISGHFLQINAAVLVSTQQFGQIVPISNRLYCRTVEMYKHTKKPGKVPKKLPYIGMRNTLLESEWNMLMTIPLSLTFQEC